MSGTASGLALRSVELDDIQLLRYWRNLNHVRSMFLDSHIIGREEQRVWFSDVADSGSKFFIYSLDDVDVGVVSATKIDRTVGSFEGGIFCGNVDFLGHWINVWAVVSLYKFAFFELELQLATARIRLDNSTALRFNRLLGFRQLNDNNSDVGLFELRIDEFTIQAKRLQAFLNQLIRDQNKGN